MAGIINLIKRSGYLKFMFACYILTLGYLGSHLVSKPTVTQPLHVVIPVVSQHIVAQTSRTVKQNMFLSNPVHKGQKQFTSNLIPRGQEQFISNPVHRGQEQFTSKLVPRGQEQFISNPVPKSQEQFISNLVPRGQEQVISNLVHKGQGQFISKLISKGQKDVANQCSAAAFPHEHLQAETWQKVGPSNSTLVFSAYHEEWNNKWIKIIGLTVHNPKRQLCQLWYKGNVSTFTGVNGSTTLRMRVANGHIVMLQSAKTKYISCLIKCALPNDRIPFAVSIVSESSGCVQADNVVKIRRLPKPEYTRNFTVCLSPLNFRYGRAYELVEWIELNIILGADKFIVYNYSSATTVRAVLEYYAKLGFVEIVQWPLPIRVDTLPRTNGPIDVFYFAQTAALNECLLRSKSDSQYVVNIDLDEFIIPHSNVHTWTDLIGGQPVSGVYMFRNSFFRKEWSTGIDFPDKDEAEHFRLVTLLKQEREREIWRTRQRSKYIARTSAVETINTHDVYRLVPGESILTVSPDMGLLHHYRNWLTYNDTQTRVSDTTVLEKYAKNLVSRVRTAWSTLKDVELDIPIDI